METQEVIKLWIANILITLQKRLQQQEIMANAN